MKHYYITNSDFPQGLSCFSSVPHARKYPAGRRNYSERSFGTTLNSKEEENALQDRWPPESGDPGGASLHRRNIMEGRCQYTVFFSAALNLQNIQITDKKLSPISPSFNPCGPCGPQRLPVLHHRGPRRISILAVLADCDKDWQGVFLDTDSISILAVLADRDMSSRRITARSATFQSLRSLRTATLTRKELAICRKFQSSRSLRTATFLGAMTRARRTVFQSSRSLRTATESLLVLIWTLSLFQSSRSLRTATRDGARPGRAKRISILAVLADRDKRAGLMPRP